jgi:hypothetical protein
MPKRIKQVKRPKDVNQLAHYLGTVSTEQADPELPTKAQVSLLMSKLGKKGGKIGGKRRLQTMTSEERSEVARSAAKARWKSSTS